MKIINGLRFHQCQGQKQVNNVCFLHSSFNFLNKNAFFISGAATVALDSNRFWILGGFNNSRSSLDQGTVIYDSASNQWEPGPSLPMPLAFHCAVQLDADHTLVAGGMQGVASSDPMAHRHTWIFDWQLQEWSEEASMTFPRSGIRICNAVSAERERERGDR